METKISEGRKEVGREEGRKQGRMGGREEERKRWMRAVHSEQRWQPEQGANARGQAVESVSSLTPTRPAWR